MANEWHFTQNGQQAATPVSGQQLKQLAASGQIQPNDLVWREGMSGWMPASTIKDLFSLSRPPEAEAPPDEIIPKKRPAKKKTQDDEQQQHTVGEGMHPLLALLLTLITGGLFGLWYAYRVSSDFQQQVPQRDRDANGKALGTSRHPLAVLLLSYLTLGWYFLYWVYRTIHESSTYLGQPLARPRTELTLILLFPVYGVYLALFHLPNHIRRAQAQAQVKDPVAFQYTFLFLNPCLLWGLPVLAMAYQDALNRTWASAP